MTSSDKSTQSNIQTWIIGVGAVIVVLLTVLIAIFLASRDLQDTQGTVATAPPNAATQAPPTPTTAIGPNTAATATSDMTIATSEATFQPATATSPPSPTPSPPPAATATLTNTPDPTATPCVPREDWVYYIVQPGDTLHSLAADTNTTPEQLKLANCLTSDNVHTGQQLKLPFIPTPTPLPPTVTPTPTATLIPTETPTKTATPFDVSLGTPTTTPTDALPVELP